MQKKSISLSLMILSLSFTHMSLANELYDKAKETFEKSMQDPERPNICGTTLAKNAVIGPDSSRRGTYGILTIKCSPVYKYDPWSHLQIQFSTSTTKNHSVQHM